jgi:hypothetical protein
MAEIYNPDEWTREALEAYAAKWDHHLDMGIVKAVKVLRDNNIATTECCEGGDGHACPWPTVRFVGSPGEAWKAVGWLLDWQLPVRYLGLRWAFDPIASCLPNGPE